MNENKDLFELTCDACIDVYENNIDLGTTEFNLETIMFRDNPHNLLSFAGTNELKDWGPNVNLFSKRGIKKSAYKAAKEVYEIINNRIDFPLIVTGHSKAGAEAIAWKKLYGAEYCVAFAPARSLRYWADLKMDNTWVFIDPDDPVSKLGFLSFQHPECEKLYGIDDPEWFKVGDHPMINWKNFIKKI